MKKLFPVTAATTYTAVTPLTLRRFLIAAFVACLLVVPALATASEYRMVRLGSIPGGSGGTAYAINDAGTIVGWTQLSGDRVAVWRNGSCELMGGISGEAYGINNSGAIVGVNRLGTSYGFLYSGYIMHDLGNLRMPNAINDAGWIAGTRGRDGFGWSSCAWTPDGTFIDLPGNGNQAFGVNSSLQFVGNFYLGSPAVRWTVDPLTLAVRMDYYQNLSGFTTSTAYAINDNGVTAGQSGSRPVIWTSLDAAPIDILSGYSSSFSGQAMSINAAGQVVGNVRGDFGGVQKVHAFVWDSVNGLSFLPDLGEESGACGINNFGQIVGQAWQASVSSGPVLWEQVPEPSSIIALLGALAGLLGVRRRRG